MSDRKENIGKVITIDGQKYILMKEFWNLGDEYNDTYEDKWIFFAFNKPEDGSIKIYDGVFGSSYDEIDNYNYNYDIFVLKKYLTEQTDDMVNEIINNGSFDEISGEFSEIQNILVKYSKKIFENNLMSPLAHYCIRHLFLSDWNMDNEVQAIWFYDDTPTLGNENTNLCSDELEAEFPDYKIIGEHCISYACIDDKWSEGLINELVDAYKNIGWVKSEKSDPVDPYSSPNMTDGIIFVKLQSK